MEAIQATMPIIIIVAAGVFFRKINLLSAGTIQDMKTLIVRVTLPLLLFQAFCEMQFQFRFLIIIALIFFACLLVFLLTGRLISHFNINQPYLAFLMAGFEAGMLGYAMFAAVFGQDKIPAFALVDLGQVLFVFFVLLPALENLQGGKSSFKQVVLNFLETPVIIAILAGLVFNLTGLYTAISNFIVFQWIWKAFEILAALTTPLVAIVIGAELFFKRESIKLAILTVALRLLVWVPLAMLFNHFIIGDLLRLDQTYRAAVFMMSILPAPFVVPIYLREGDIGKRDLILSTLSIGTIVSLLGAVVVRILYG